MSANRMGGTYGHGRGGVRARYTTIAGSCEPPARCQPSAIPATTSAGRAFGDVDLNRRDEILGDQPRLDRVVQEYRVQRVPRRGAQPERDVRDAENNAARRESLGDEPHALERLQAELAVVLVAGADREGQDVEEDVLGPQAVVVDADQSKELGRFLVAESNFDVAGETQDTGDISIFYDTWTKIDAAAVRFTSQNSTETIDLRLG